MANVAMKVNVRLGNTSHTFTPPAGSSTTAMAKLVNDRGELDTMILGADVTHTQKDSAAGSHSLAALVGSVDNTFGQFYGSMRYQEKNKEASYMGASIGSLLPTRDPKTGTVRPRAPLKILYYRDGVDDGQYSAVRKNEVQEIKRAWQSFTATKHLQNYPRQPLVTAIVVTKRHRTRFYPTHPPHTDNQNCPAGTCVDSGVTHPTFFDFFLQFHKPGPGTAKPTYYIVLENGMRYSPNELQDFTNWLCYTYVRTPLPVGYAPPTYYADRLCDRARSYFAEHLKTVEREIGMAKEGRRVFDAEARSAELWVARYNDNGERSSDGAVVGRPNRHGPWHRNLNDTMFWM